MRRTTRDRALARRSAAPVVLLMRHRWTGLGVLSIVSVLVVLFSDGCAASTTTIVLGGDVMLGRGVAERLGGDWPAAFADVEPLLTSADVAFVNLESPLTTSPKLDFVQKSDVQDFGTQHQLYLDWGNRGSI